MLSRLAALVLAAGGLAPGAWGQDQPPRQPAPPPVPTEQFDRPAPTPQESDEAQARLKALAEQAAALEQARFPVTEFVIEYATPHPNLPSIQQVLEEALVTLVRGPDGYHAARYTGGGEPLGPVSVADLGTLLKGQAQDAASAPKFSAAAIRAVLDALRDALSAREILGIFVEVDREDIDQSGEILDLREGRTALRARIFVPLVTQVRTVAAGERITGDQRVNAPEHARILGASPVQPQREGEAERRDLLLKDDVDEYVLRLNRYPNRRVDVALSADDTQTAAPGSVVVDYLVREAKPWLFYVQGSNTGTKQAGEWRERFGTVLYQLLDRDDVLTADYVTAGFDTTHAFNGSYEIPVDVPDRTLRLRANGNFTRYDASEVGASGERFTGESYYVGGDVNYLLFQYRELFIDAFGGARFQRARVTNSTNPLSVTRGETDFVLPRVGLSLDRFTEEAATSASVAFEWNAYDLAGTDEQQLQRLGRPAVDESFTMFQFGAEQSLYLEPLIDRDNWLAGQSTLAHELFFNLRGQWTLGDQRLAPNFQQVAGGLYSVRGYPESITSGDTVVVGTAEYRLHIPRLFAVNNDPPMLFGEPFRWSPQQPYGRPDWDLLVRAFVDVGQTINNRRQTFERDNLIVGVGFGLELQLKRNLNVRVDFGWGLEEIEAVPTGTRYEQGDNRVHFVGTLLF